ncbi:hypothetical protein ABT346_08585 [Micromonospora peucetia]|uniref:hypothetical protein n=1 Tax=Micromonospora peucetia TaxID=47871 RepID=UPI003329934F
MGLGEPELVWVVLRLLIVVVSLFLLVLGVRVAVSRRVPGAWSRFARLTESQRSQPVRLGGNVTLLGASLLVQQTPFLVPVPHPVGDALFAVALLLVVAAMVWFVLVRR